MLDIHLQGIRLTDNARREAPIFQVWGGTTRQQINAR